MKHQELVFVLQTFQLLDPISMLLKEDVGQELEIVQALLQKIAQDQVALTEDMGELAFRKVVQNAISSQNHILTQFKLFIQVHLGVVQYLEEL